MTVKLILVGLSSRDRRLVLSEGIETVKTARDVLKEYLAREGAEVPRRSMTAAFGHCHWTSLLINMRARDSGALLIFMILFL
jgi:hypothetical protein